MNRTSPHRQPPVNRSMLILLESPTAAHWPTFLHMENIRNLPRGKSVFVLAAGLSNPCLSDSGNSAGGAAECHGRPFFGKNGKRSCQDPQQAEPPGKAGL